MYARNISKFVIGRTERTAEANARYSNRDNDPRGVWKSDNLAVKSYSHLCDYPITTPSGRIVHPPKGSCWRITKEEFENRVADNRIWFGADGNNVPSIKRFLSELKFEGMAPTSLLFHKKLYSEQEQVQELNELFELTACDGTPASYALLERLNKLKDKKDKASAAIVSQFIEGLTATYGAHNSFLLREKVGDSQEGTRNLKALFDDSLVFDSPKPLPLIRHLMTLANLEDDAIVMDFFSGRATTAHALFQHNEHHHKHCRFILVQIPEQITSEKVDARFDNICTMAKERIKRAGKKITELMQEQNTAQDRDIMPLFALSKVTANGGG